MQTNQLSLGSDMMDNLDECKVGDEKTLSVPVRVTGYSDKGAQFEVIGPPSIAAHSVEEETPAETASEGGEEEPGEMSPGMQAMMGKT